ncbi:MAG: hypothetical protein JSR59_11490 [Proteobacteria bacterium]|nr:hypothetical protein [Pseudomonadota bacterium]
MDKLQALADELAELRGQLLALECTVNALVLRLPNQAGVVLEALHATESFAYARALAASGASKTTIDAFDGQTQRIRQLLECKDLPRGSGPGDTSDL